MAKTLEHYIWRLCANCTVRNCRKEPKPKTGGYYCNKRREYKGGFKLVEVAAKTNPVALLKVLYDHGMEVKETKRGGLKAWKLR